jgi:hypothetical protein
VMIILINVDKSIYYTDKSISFVSNNNTISFYVRAI